MPRSKPGALPLGDIPKNNFIVDCFNSNQRMVRKERLELSHLAILEPKSSASTNSATSAYLFSSHSYCKKEWLGYQDLNLGMPRSKPGALPLGDIPTNNFIVDCFNSNQRMVRKERLELSHLAILEPKSSASTNSATSAYLFFVTFLLVERMAGIPGFEPGNAEIKTRCLTAWRYPNK